MNHFFFDAETFGQNPHDCAVIDISGIVVNTDKMLSDKPYTLSSVSEVKRFKLSVKDQVETCGRVVYMSGIDY